MIKDKGTFLKELALLPELENETIVSVFANNLNIDFDKKSSLRRVKSK